MVSKVIAYVRQPHVQKFILEACVVIALLTAVVAERGVIAVQRHIMPAGDVFNFQTIARGIRYFNYPVGEKRLPGYPLTLLVGTELGFDPTTTGIVVSILSSAATTLVLYLLGRHFKFPIFPLAVVLLLTAVAPLITINGVRPLSDSYFMFLTVLSVYVATVAKPTRGWAMACGCVFTLLVFTRYEGGPTVLVLLPLLRFRMPWKLVGVAAIPLVVAGLLWLPVAKHVNGSFSNFGYTKDAQQNASLKTLPADYMRIVKSAGFEKGWMIADLWSSDTQLQVEAKELPHALGWWLSILASFGMVWLLFSYPKEAAPVLLVFLFYPVIPAWWFTYSRYVAPMSAFYFFCMAAGVVGLWTLVMKIFRTSPRHLQIGVTIILAVLLVKGVFEVAPAMYRESVGRSLENNGNGYSLYSAVKSLEKGKERVAVWADYPVASLAFGNMASPKSGQNAARGMYLLAKPDASTLDWAQYVKENDAQILIDSGEKGMKELVDYLQAHHQIVRTDTVQWPRQDKDIDTTRIHYLQF